MEDEFDFKEEPDVEPEPVLPRARTPVEPVQDTEEIRLLRRGRRRRILTRFLLLGLVGTAVWLGVRYQRHGFSLVAALEAQVEPDAPARLLPNLAVPTLASNDLPQWRHLLGEVFPAWLDEHRKFRKLEARRAGSGDAVALEAARKEVMAAVEDDTQLAPIFNALTSLADGNLEAHAAEASQLLDTLQKVMAGRKLPFVVEGQVASAEDARFVQARFYERLGTERYRLEDKAVSVEYRDRVDLLAMNRDPEQVLQPSKDPVVLVRAVLADAYGTLLPALAQDGVWQLTRVPPTAPELRRLETRLGELVRAEWDQSLAGLASPARRALKETASVLSRRAALFREVVQRDPLRPLWLELTSARLTRTDHLWFKKVEPYIARGMVRLQLADLERLKTWDTSLRGTVMVATPALQAVLREQLRLAALQQVRQARALAPDFPVPPVLVNRPGGGQGLAAEVAARFTALAESPESCMTALAIQASDAFDLAPSEAARVVLRRMGATGLGAQALSEETLPDVLTSLEKEGCPQLNALARSRYEALFGPYTPITPPVATLAERAPRTTAQMP